MTALPPVYSTAAIREVEAIALRNGLPLMARAGLAAATLARQLLGDGARQRVLVIAGPGNNGGDAFETAAHLKQAAIAVSVVFTGDVSKLPADAARALAKWRAAGGELAADIAPGPWNLVIDGLFGIGLARALEGRHAALVNTINVLAESGIPVLALDVPSGIHSDTGAIMGVAVRATHTLTFIAHKPGLLTLDGPDHCGILECDALGVDAAALSTPDGALVTDAILAEAPRRPRNFHKGMAGEVGVIGGTDGMVGAVLLSARAALHSGAGKVFVGFVAADPPGVDPQQPELMMRTPQQSLAESAVLLAGPGMGTGTRAAGVLREVLSVQKPLVLDADALNLIAADGSLAALTAQRTASTLMTPHPAEAARLLATGTADVQRDRIAAATALAKHYRCIVVLKGNGSVLAAPDGAWWINASGNPGMASAGMGDVLGGLLASLIAQQLEPLAATQLAVWLHGAAADELAAAGHGPIGITASDVITQIRVMLNRPLKQPVGD